MKHNKLFAMLAMAAALTLAACGGNGGSASSKTSGKSGGSQSSQPKPSTSKAPVKAAEIESVSLTKKESDSKVYVQLKGSETLYTAADELKFAFGISTDASLPQPGDDGTVSSANFVYGHAVPEAADFKAVQFTPAADASKVEFTIEYCITDIANIPTDVYHFFGGFTAETYDVLEFEGFTGRDAKYDYFMRDDQSSTGLAIEDLGPFAITEGSVVKLTAADLPTPADGQEQTLPEGYYAKLGGTQAQTYTMETVSGWNTHCDFQRTVPSYSKSALNNWFWKIEGTKLFIYMSVAGMQQGEEYMTHIGANCKNQREASNPGKALPSAEILTNNVYSFEDDNIKFEIVGDPSKGQDDGEPAFYGAIGVKVSYVVEPSTDEGGEEA